MVLATAAAPRDRGSRDGDIQGHTRSVCSHRDMPQPVPEVEIKGDPPVRPPGKFGLDRIGPGDPN